MESLAGREIGRVEPPHRAIPVSRSPTYVCMAAQDAFEAELRRHAETYPEIELRFNSELAAFEQDDIGVTATLGDRRSGQIQTEVPWSDREPDRAKSERRRPGARSADSWLCPLFSIPEYDDDLSGLGLLDVKLR